MSSTQNNYSIPFSYRPPSVSLRRTFPSPPLELDSASFLMAPVHLGKWVAAHAAAAPDGSAVLCGPGARDPSLAGFEFMLAAFTAPHNAWGGPPPPPPAAAATSTAAGGDSGSSSGSVDGGRRWPGRVQGGGGEVFLYQLSGDAAVTVTPVAADPDSPAGYTAAGPPVSHALPAGHVMLVPGGRRFGVRVDFAARGSGGATVVVTNAAAYDGANAA